MSDVNCKKKPINLHWIKEIPAEWDIVRNRHIFIESKDTVGDKNNEYELLSLTVNGVIKRDVESGKGKFSSDVSSFKVVKKDDFVFCLFDVDETPRTIGVSDYDGMITGAYDIFKCKYGVPKYFYYYYLALDNLKLLKPLYTGLRKVVKMPTFKQLFVPFPPIEEQKKIVEYLDKKVSDYTLLINKCKKLIDYYKEYLVKYIDDNLTKVENVELIDSGVEWLGFIPANWELTNVGKIYKERKTKVSDKEYEPLSVSKQGVTKQLEDVVKTNNGDDRKLVLKGDFVINSRSDRRNACGISEFDGSVSLINIVCEPRKKLDVNYFEKLFRSCKFANEFYRLGTGIVPDLWSTKWDKFKKMIICVPPMDIQQDIVNKINKEEERVNELINKFNSIIDYSEEYINKLLFDVVVGKMRVGD